MHRPSIVVLGRPGSGCSTLLKTLANQRGEYHAVTGAVHYDSLTPDEIARHYRGDVQYCPEDDVHFPTLSVEQVSVFSLLFLCRVLILFDRQSNSLQKHVPLMLVLIINRGKNTQIS